MLHILFSNHRFKSLEFNITVYRAGFLPVSCRFLAFLIMIPNMHETISLILHNILNVVCIQLLFGKLG